MGPERVHAPCRHLQPSPNVWMSTSRCTPHCEHWYAQLVQYLKKPTQARHKRCELQGRRSLVHGNRAVLFALMRVGVAERERSSRVTLAVPSSEPETRSGGPCLSGQQLFTKLSCSAIFFT